jgi:hypothetical protein
MVLLAWTLTTAAATAQDAIPVLGFAAQAPAPTAAEANAQPCASCESQGRFEDNCPRRPMSEGMQRASEVVARPFVDCLNRKGLGCCSTLNDFGCGSLYSHCNFIFGSCRQFLNQPCLRPPYGQPCGGAFGCGR